MANPNIRTVTGKSTIPASVPKLRYLTALAGHTNRLTYSGTQAELDAALGTNNTAQEKNNLWIYIPARDKLVKLLSWGNKVIKVEGDVSDVDEDTWELVEANLAGWSVLNVGGASATVNGETLIAGASISFSDADAPTLRRNFVDAVLVDGTSSDLLIQEKLG